MKNSKKARLFSALPWLFETSRRDFYSWYLRLNLRLHRVTFGKNLQGNQCKIQSRGSIELGNNVDLWSYPDGENYKTCLLTYLPSSSIKIGNNCTLNGTVIHSRSKVVIGENCMFGAGVVIMDSNFHSTSRDPAIRRPPDYAVDRPVVLGNNVWVGRNSIILKGVSIGDNSIVAAGSIVTRDIPPNQLFGGNPAQFIRILNE